jgi:hypothetical protein
MLPSDIGLMQESASGVFLFCGWAVLIRAVRQNPEHTADPAKLQCGPR